MYAGFAEAAVGRPLGDTEVVDVMTQAARALGLRAYELDWRIWEASRSGALPPPPGLRPASARRSHVTPTLAGEAQAAARSPRLPSALAADAVSIPIKRVGVRRTHGEEAATDLGAIQIRRWRRDAEVRVGRIARAARLFDQRRLR